MMNKKTISHLTEKDNSSLQWIKSLLDEYPDGEHSLKLLSKRAGINRVKLTYGFKFLFGTTLHRYIIQKRIEKARSLLNSTNMPVKAIAAACGYKTTQHFITAFKKHTAQSPGHYRKSEYKGR
jgi:AraC-like DNA-binding protein